VIHLGDNLSALVDGELAGADLDRANAHLAACERCRGDAAALRALKTQLRDLAAHTDHDDLTLRLLAMAGPSAGPPDGDEEDRSPRRRYLVWSALSLAVMGGVGAAAFSMGGGPSGPGPDVVPQVEMFSVQHASTTGDVPFPEPSRLPVRVAKHTP
jgi:anti-sigma factor RsiW